MGRSAARFVLAAAGLAVALGDCDPPPDPDRCRALYAARQWRAAELACSASNQQPHAELARSWLSVGQGTDDPQTVVKARALVERFAGTEFDADALCIAGNEFGRMNLDRPGNEEIGRALLRDAVTAYQRRGQHASAAHAALFLAMVPRPTAKFEDALRSAELARSEAELSNDDLALGMAYTALARASDDVGMADDARDLFVMAEERLKPWPDKLVYTYLNHGTFLLDLGEFENALGSLDEAKQHAARAEASGSRLRREHVTALHLNRAFTLAMLDRFEEATAELSAIAPRNPAEACKLELVHGYVAARRSDLAAAERHFALTEPCDLDPDYEWRLAYEIGELHRRAGQLGAAERAYWRAIDAVEEVRKDAGNVELRPWVLAHRAPPYLALLRLLTDQNRGLEALEVAELLHARAWLDTVLGAASDDRLAAEALIGARVRTRYGSERRLDRWSLLRRIAGREALVFVRDGDHIWRAHVQGGDVTLARLGPEVTALARAFALTPQDRDLAERAGAALLPAALTSRELPLYVVANGELAAIPFAALRRHGRYLVDERPIARLPGLAMLRCLARTWNDRRIFVGDASGNLPAAAAEVRRHGGDDAKIGAAATTAVILEAREATSLHIAVHGENTRDGGVLQFADGPLTAAAVVEAEIAPHTVVLTSCATAVSQDAEAWGAFPSAFLAAGSRHVVASLRRVEDPQAASFAAHYYGAPANLDPIRRLAVAQRAMAADGEPVEAWASFTAWGVAECP